MNKIIMMKGLPASGKSTWAKQFLRDRNFLGEKWKRVNKDDLRAMLDESRWSRENEKFVLALRDDLIVLAIVKGYNVIVDDTNYAPKHEESFREVAKRWKVGFEIKDFSDVSPEECIKRDLARPNSVGSKVIMQMYNQYIKPKAEPIKKNPQLPLCIVCDLDGTLCLFDGDPYERDFTQDRVNEPVADIVRRFAESGTKVFYVSGRKDKFRGQTEQWLKKYMLDYASPLMRKTDDERKDAIVKKEIYEESIKGKYNVQFVLDDRNQMVDMWRSLGITCLQVAEGDF